MRWAIVRLICLRELRDQLRDRRTIFMIVGLPLLLYPLLGVAILRFAQGFLAKPSTVAVERGPGGSGNFPAGRAGTRTHPPVLLGWLTLMPAAADTGLGRLAGATALVEASEQVLDYPLLIENGRPAPAYREMVAGPLNLRIEMVDPARSDALLAGKKVDLVLSAPPDFLDEVAHGGQPRLTVRLRRNDDRSRQAEARLARVLEQWRRDLKSVRLARQGLPGSFDEVFAIDDRSGALAGAVSGRSLFDVILRVFPFILVMWSLAGALYPAVDLCAGEKERGTMETLLISPARRDEIVWGKFLTIWVFSAATSLLNLASMGLSTWLMGPRLAAGSFSLAALGWCVVLLVPLSAFFSAVSLAVGAYARSTKEGQYYLMPLFLVTMPLIFLTLAPGVELNPFYSMVPVTGVGLLMQRLMTAPSVGQIPWGYFVPVLAPVVLYSWLALRWAVEQFQREEVLFREAERLDVGLWLRRLFREKEAAPTGGQALFCFGLLLLLRWLSLDLGAASALPVRSSVIELSFVAAPPLFMALLLTTRPRASLNLRAPRLPHLLAAALLLPLAEVVRQALHELPDLEGVLLGRQVFVAQAFGGAGRGGTWAGFLLALAVVPAVCEELAFRGLILNGFRRRFRPWPAVFLSAFFFAVYHTDVFAAGPLFLLGSVLGMLALYSGSIWPGVLLHAGCRLLLLTGPLVAASDLGGLPLSAAATLLLVTAAICTVLAAALLWRLRPQEPA